MWRSWCGTTGPIWLRGSPIAELPRRAAGAPQRARPPNSTRKDEKARGRGKRAGSLRGIEVKNLHHFPDRRDSAAAISPAGLPTTLRAITPAIAECERLRLLRARHFCWYCEKVAPADSWLFSCRMNERPTAMLVCPGCLDRVRRWRPGIRTLLFPPLGATPGSERNA